MFFAPFPLLFTWLVGLLSLALLGGGVYLLWAWYVGAVVGTGYLVSGLAMTLWSLFGRWVVLAFHPRGSDEPHTLQPDAQTRLSRPDGTNLYVERYGSADAPAVVLTHGAGANRTSWYYAIRALSQRFQVLVWDMPGLGHSDKPRHGDYSLERHAQDLEAVLGVALASISVPTLVLTGHLDRLIVPETARFMVEHVPPAHLSRLEPAGHMAVFERHDRLVAELTTLVDEVLAPRGLLDHEPAQV